MLTREEIIEILKKTNSLKTGHFLLSSGLHSDKYVQCALVLSYPWEAENLCKALAEKLADIDIEIVVGPALGGIVIAYELARALNVPGIFAERTDGEMAFRRGFEIKPGQKVLVVEDVVTTGGSAKEAIKLIKEMGGDVVAVSSLIDRSGGKADFGVPFKALLELDIPTYKPEDCPMCKDGSTAEKPGSRK
ncbi:MAG: orotate phosphoribosyltransferase [Desulfitibacter sp. BRH_c19]|nr:MAG: orotate phosphoribosyltransferase [Desulfitibacter sp. BRH_c19]